MNKLPTKLIAVAILISTAVSSMASEITTAAPSRLPSINPVPRTASTVLSKQVALNSTQLAKYQLLAVQSQGLASGPAAGANSKTKTVLIVVGVVVVVVGVVALAGRESMKNTNLLAGM